MGEFSSLARRVRRMKRDIRSEVGDAVQDTLADAEDTAQGTIRRHNAVASTVLVRGFEQDVERLGDNDRYILRNIAPHAPYVEYGTGDKYGVTSYPIDSDVPHFDAPSFSPALVKSLRRWVIIKPSVDPENSPLTAAVAIAQVISGEVDGKPSGTSPVPFMRRAYFKHVAPGGLNSVDNRVRIALKKAVSRL